MDLVDAIVHARRPDSEDLKTLIKRKRGSIPFAALAGGLLLPSLLACSKVTAVSHGSTAMPVVGYGVVHSLRWR